MRECFVPRPGRLYAAADYAGMELRTWAQVCIAALGRSRMAEVLNAGGDPHLQIAATILGVAYREAETLKNHPTVDNTRQVGKVANFGLPGGLGVATLVEYAWGNYGVALTLEQSRELKEQWLRTWPEAREYLDWIHRLTDQGSTVVQLYSRRVHGGVSYTKAANGFFQGLAADAAGSAGFLLARACYVDRASVLFGSRPVNFIHDEFLVEVPEERGHECALELARLMVVGASPWLPDVPPKAEPLLMRRWSKKAKPVWREGRLVPWGDNA